MNRAHRNPRLPASCRMVAFTGPPGTAVTKPQITPSDNAVTGSGNDAAMGLFHRCRRGFVILLILDLDFPLHLARNAWPDESIDQIGREEDRRHNRQHLLPQD